MKNESQFVMPEQCGLKNTIMCIETYIYTIIYYILLLLFKKALLLFTLLYYYLKMNNTCGAFGSCQLDSDWLLWHASPASRSIASHCDNCQFSCSGNSFVDSASNSESSVLILFITNQDLLNEFTGLSFVYILFKSCKQEQNPSKKKLLHRKCQLA